MTPVSIRMTDAHRDKLEQLGGAAWIRAVLDVTPPFPSGISPQKIQLQIASSMLEAALASGKLSEAAGAHVAGAQDCIRWTLELTQ